VERGRSALRAREGRGGWGGGTEKRMEAARAVEEDEKGGEEEEGVESLLSPGQIRMFEREQEDMVKFYNSELLKIRFVVYPNIPFALTSPKPSRVLAR
jgi:hypothetical protein